MTGFTSNSIAYYLGDDPTLQFQDFGNNGVPNLAVPWLESESSYTAENFDQNGNRVVIWPGSSITDIHDGNTGIAVWGVAIWGPADKSLYNTLVTITVNATGPHIERTVPEFIQAGNIQYGNWGSTISASGKLLLLAASGGGLKVARVDPDSATDLTKVSPPSAPTPLTTLTPSSQYEYYHGPTTHTWSATPPESNSTAANLFTVGAWFGGSGSGDVFWSLPHRTYLCVYFNGLPDNTFYVRYALAGRVAGRWSDEQVLYVTAPAPNDPGDPFNYAGHANPTWDPSGRTLALSWSYGGAWTQVAVVSWL
ncbi:hypothetical protein MMC17_006395 [Xylographa soralifera]|nr:hypothetical protein [Xylographa soralifera]